MSGIKLPFLNLPHETLMLNINKFEAQNTITNEKRIINKSLDVLFHLYVELIIFS